MPVRKEKRWVASVKTDSTHPPAGLFTKDAATVARTLASKRVSPKGPSSGLRMPYLLHQSRGTPECKPPGRTCQSQGTAFEANSGNQAIDPSEKVRIIRDRNARIAEWLRADAVRSTPADLQQAVTGVLGVHSRLP